MRAATLKCILILASLLAVTFPLTLLLLNSATGFTSDWYNNLWMIGHMSNYFLAHGSFPISLNAITMVGITFPVLYGHLLYPLTGLVGAAVGPNTALRGMCFAVYVIQFAVVYKTTLIQNAGRVTAFVVSALAMWAIYPLSNLYARSAIPEFLAVSLLISATSLWFQFIKEKSGLNRLRLAFYISFLFSLMFGFHAITAYYGSLSAAIIFLGSIYLVRPPIKEIKTTAMLVSMVAALTLLSSSCWLTAYHSFKSQLAIAEQLGRNTYLGGVDELWIRILPFPFDLRSHTGGASTPTTYLDAQINLPLLATLLWAIWDRIGFREWRKLFADRAGQMALACIVVSLFILIVSVSESMGAHFIRLFKNFQIAYRMTNYTNIFFLYAIYFAMNMQPVEHSDVTARSVIGAAVQSAAMAVAICAVLTKLLHGSVVWGEASKYQYNLLTSGHIGDFTSIPKSFYSLASYAINPGSHSIAIKDLAINEQVIFPVNSDKKFGETTSVEKVLEKGRWVASNVYPFPWNQIWEDGGPIPQERLGITAEEFPRITILATKSTPTVFTFVQQPDKNWLFWKAVSGVVFWSSLTGALAIFSCSFWSRCRKCYRTFVDSVGGNETRI